MTGNSMSIVEVKVPQLSESVAEATLLQWKKNPGDRVELDEILIEIETDKVVLEVPAPAAGTLARVSKPAGSTVVSGEVIASIDPQGKAEAAPAKAPAAKEASAGATAASAAAPAPAASAKAAAAEALIAMPAAAKRMAEAGLSSSQVAGTGLGGRITKGDVLAALEAPPKPATAAAAPSSVARMLPDVRAPIDGSLLSGRPEQRVPMSRLRQRVAERL